ncbi:MAG: hypothetical protein Q4D16_10195 [Eubacteriales bacterium]|nr:hypothetical protein [Eubacteriales bacterium]
MKRFKCVYFVLAMLCLTVACGKHALPQNTFPLEDEVITDALEKTGLEGEISESETIANVEEQIMHVVRSKTEIYSDMIFPVEDYSDPTSKVIVAGITSSVIEGRRLSLFFQQKDVSDQLVWEDWKKQMVFAALLYGGFENEEEVYQAFNGKELPEGKEAFQWDAELPSAYCRVAYHSRIYYDEYGIKRLSPAATMRVNIYESKSLYQKLITTNMMWKSSLRLP